MFSFFRKKKEKTGNRENRESPSRQRNRSPSTERRSRHLSPSPSRTPTRMSLSPSPDRRRNHAITSSPPGTKTTSSTSGALFSSNVNDSSTTPFISAEKSIIKSTNSFDIDSDEVFPKDSNTCDNLKSTTSSSAAASIMKTSSTPLSDDDYDLMVMNRHGRDSIEGCTSPVNILSNSSTPDTKEDDEMMLEEDEEADAENDEEDNLVGCLDFSNQEIQQFLVPCAISTTHFKFIHTLILRKNLLTNISDMSLTHLTGLTDLDLAYNSLQGSLAPNSLPPSLLRLDLSHNSLTDVSSLLPLIYLRGVNLSHNKLKIVEGLPTNVIILDLSHNLLPHAHSLRVLSVCKNLEVICVEGNPFTQSSSSSSSSPMKETSPGRSSSSSSTSTSQSQIDWKVVLTSLFPQLLKIDNMPRPISTVRRIPGVGTKLHEVLNVNTSGSSSGSSIGEQDGASLLTLSPFLETSFMWDEAKKSPSKRNGDITSSHQRKADKERHKRHLLWLKSVERKRKEQEDVFASMHDIGISPSLPAPKLESLVTRLAQPKSPQPKYNPNPNPQSPAKVKAEGTKKKSKDTSSSSSSSSSMGGGEARKIRGGKERSKVESLQNEDSAEVRTSSSSIGESMSINNIETLPKPPLVSDVSSSAPTISTSASPPRPVIRPLRPTMQSSRQSNISMVVNFCEYMEQDFHFAAAILSCILSHFPTLVANDLHIFVSTSYTDFKDESTFPLPLSSLLDPTILLSYIQKLAFYKGQIEPGVEDGINALWDHEEEVGGGTFRRGRETVEKIRKFSTVLNKLEAEVMRKETKDNDNDHDNNDHVDDNDKVAPPPLLTLPQLQRIIMGIMKSDEGRYVIDKIMIPLGVAIHCNKN